MGVILAWSFKMGTFCLPFLEYLQNGSFKKTVFTHPVQDGPESPPGVKLDSLQIVLFYNHMPYLYVMSFIKLFIIPFSLIHLLSS